MNVHELKVEMRYWPYYKNGEKSFSIRNNDRNFAVGDTCVFKLFNNKTFIVNEIIVKKISFILHDYETRFLKEGYCVLGLKDV